MCVRACVRACAYRRGEIGLTRANRFTFTSTSVSALEIDATLEISVRIGFARSACVSIRRRSADSPSPMRCGPPYPRWRWRSVAGAPIVACAHYRVHTPERGSLRTQSPRGEHEPIVAWAQGALTGKTTSQIANIISTQLVRGCSCCRVGRVPPSAHTDYYECKCATNAALILSRACGGYWLHKGSLSVRVGRTASQQCAQWATT